MTITVTSLGTVKAKTTAKQYFYYADGLVLSANDTIVVCGAETKSDWNYKEYVTFVDVSTGIRYHLLHVVADYYGLNASSGIFVGVIPVDTESGDYLEVSSGISDTTAWSFYKITGASFGKLANFTNDTSISEAWAATYGTEAANYYFSFKACTITSLDLNLSKIGTPPAGTLYVRIKDKSHNTLGTLGSLDTITGLTTTSTWYTFNTSSVQISTDQPIYICVEYPTTTDTNNTVRIGVDTTADWQSTFLVKWDAETNIIGYPQSHRSISIRNLTLSSGTAQCYKFSVDIHTTGEGSGTTQTVATSALASAHEIAIASIGINNPIENASGTWTTGSGYISGNNQRDGTTGAGAGSNIIVDSSIEVMSESVAQTAEITGSPNADWNGSVATLKAYEGVASNKPAFLKGSDRVTSSKSAYLNGYTSVVRSSSSAFLKGNYGFRIEWATVGTPAVTGHATSSSKSAFLKGTASIVANKPSYLRGQLINNRSSKPAFLDGDEEIFISKPAYLHGQALTSSSKPAYIKGSTTAVSNKPAFLRGSNQSSNSKPAYLRGSVIPTPSSKPAFLLGIGDLLVPVSVTGSQGVWYNENKNTTNLYASIDETIPNDSDYIYDTDPTNGDYCEFSLSSPAGTVNSGDIVIVWRGRNASGVGTIQANVEFRQGTNIIAEHTITLTPTAQTYWLQLTPSERANITNWSDLRVRILPLVS